MVLITLLVVILGVGRPKILNGMETGRSHFLRHLYDCFHVEKINKFLATIFTGFCSVMFWYLYKENILLNFEKLYKTAVLKTGSYSKNFV